MQKAQDFSKAQLAKSKCPALYMLHSINRDEDSKANKKQPGRILPEQEAKHRSGSEKVVFNITFKHSLCHPSQTVFSR